MASGDCQLDEVGKFGGIEVVSHPILLAISIAQMPAFTLKVHKSQPTLVVKFSTVDMTFPKVPLA